MRNCATRLACAVLFVVTLGACSGEGFADTEDGRSAIAAVPPIIKQRQQNFEAIGIAFKTIRRALEDSAPDAALIATKAGEINARARGIPDHFPALTGADQGHDTQALPKIWEKPEEFKVSAAKLADESARLAVLANDGNVAALTAQAAILGETCKGCHSQFRRDETK